MTMPPQCEIFAWLAVLGVMLGTSLGILFLRHLLFSIRRKETLRETIKKAGEENTICSFTFAITLGILAQSLATPGLEMHFCGYVKTMQRACR